MARKLARGWGVTWGPGPQRRLGSALRALLVHRDSWGEAAEVDRSGAEHSCRPRRSECGLSLTMGLHRLEDNERREGLGTGAQSSAASKSHLRQRVQVLARLQQLASLRGWGTDLPRDIKEATMRLCPYQGPPPTQS